MSSEISRLPRGFQAPEIQRPLKKPRKQWKLLWKSCGVGCNELSEKTPRQMDAQGQRSEREGRGGERAPRLDAVFQVVPVSGETKVAPLLRPRRWQVPFEVVIEDVELRA